MFIPTLLADAVTMKAPAATIITKGAAQSVPLKVPGGKVVHAPVTVAPNAIVTFAPVIPKTPLAAKAPWLTHTFAAFFMISAIGLVFLLAIQTTKQEGLSGTLGGRVESAYRPRLGFDQQLQRITEFVAISFVVFGLLVSLSGI